jgi:hypothetical protein
LIGCLELDGGRQIWCHQEFLSFGAPIPKTLVDDTLVLCLGAPGCEVMGLDPASGRARWRRKHAKGLSEVATVQGGAVIVKSPSEEGEVLQAIDASNGAVVWLDRRLSADHEPVRFWRVPVRRQPDFSRVKQRAKYRQNH